MLRPADARTIFLVLFWYLPAIALNPWSWVPLWR